MKRRSEALCTAAEMAAAFSAAAVAQTSVRHGRSTNVTMTREASGRAQTGENFGRAD